MNSYGTFAFYKSNCIGNTELWRYAQTNVNIISHSVPFMEIQTLLSAKVSYDTSYSPSQFAINALMYILCHKDHMIFALCAPEYYVE